MIWGEFAVTNALSAEVWWLEINRLVNKTRVITTKTNYFLLPKSRYFTNPVDFLKLKQHEPTTHKTTPNTGKSWPLKESVELLGLPHRKQWNQGYLRFHWLLQSVVILPSNNIGQQLTVVKFTTHPYINAYSKPRYNLLLVSGRLV